MSRYGDPVLLDYLGHIQLAIGRIQRYLAEVDQASFLGNEEKQDAVIRNLEIIGEAAGNIQRRFPEFASQHPNLPLKAASGTRNLLAHGYFKVDLDVVWKTIVMDLPVLRVQIKEVIENLRNS